MGIYDLVGCLTGIIATWACAIAGAAAFGWLGGVGGGIVGFFLGFMVGNMLVDTHFWIAIAAQRRRTRRDLAPHFGRYWTEETADEWQRVKKRLEPGDALEGTVVAKYYYGVYLDVGLPFPSLLGRLDWDDATTDSDPGIGAEVMARVDTFNDTDHEIELAQREPLGGFGGLKPNRTDETTGLRP